MTVANIAADIAAAIRGAIAQEAATCETEPLVHAHFTGASAAKPTPMSAPTIVSEINLASLIHAIGSP